MENVEQELLDRLAKIREEQQSWRTREEVSRRRRDEAVESFESAKRALQSAGFSNLAEAEEAVSKMEAEALEHMAQAEKILGGAQ